jgi:hypothetical protein
MVDVRLHGRLGEDESLGDLAIGEPGSDQAEHLRLAR